MLLPSGPPSPLRFSKEYRNKSPQKMAEHPRPKGCLANMSHAIETGMNSFFTKLGWVVANNPSKTLAIALIGCLIGMGGFSILEEESRGDKLWVPTGTRAQDDYVSICQPSFEEIDLIFHTSLPC